MHEMRKMNCDDYHNKEFKIKIFVVFKNKFQKMCICVFVCASARATHSSEGEKCMCTTVTTKYEVVTY